MTIHCGKCQHSFTTVAAWAAHPCAIAAGVRRDDVELGEQIADELEQKADARVIGLARG